VSGGGAPRGTEAARRSASETNIFRLELLERLDRPRLDPPLRDELRPPVFLLDLFRLPELELLLRLELPPRLEVPPRPELRRADLRPPPERLRPELRLADLRLPPERLRAELRLLDLRPPPERLRVELRLLDLRLPAERLRAELRLLDFRALDLRRAPERLRFELRPPPEVPLRLLRVGSDFRSVPAISSRSSSLIDSYIPFDAPCSSDGLSSPRFALRAAPAAICCFFELAFGMGSPSASVGPVGGRSRATGRASPFAPPPLKDEHSRASCHRGLFRGRNARPDGA
jgi:hypothetical protein